MSRFRIGLDARLHDGLHGGVQPVLTGLAAAFSRLDDGPEEYRFLVHRDGGAWIRPLLTGPCRALDVPTPRPPRRPARWRRTARARAGARFVKPSESDGTIERAGIDLMHFTVQTAFLTQVPSVFTPHDLQHRHLPALFDRRERVEREATYARFCREALMVVALSSWGRRDLIDAYDLPPDRVHVVPNAPVATATLEPALPETQVLGAQASARDGSFLFYPAATWSHKNHLLLIDALAVLRDRDGLTVPLVCSGLETDHSRAIAARVDQLNLAASVRFAGWVGTEELRSLFTGARAMVFPSLFEGFGIPPVEAFAAGVPVACSNATCLPDLVKDAAVLFDPRRVDDIARAITEIWTNDALRARLVERGYARAADFSWDRSARLLRAHYRRLGRRPLTEEDRALLAAPPVL